jgi:hypothetical protein
MGKHAGGGGSCAPKGAEGVRRPWSHGSADRQGIGRRGGRRGATSPATPRQFADDQSAEGVRRRGSGAARRAEPIAASGSVAVVRGPAARTAAGVLLRFRGQQAESVQQICVAAPGRSRRRRSARRPGFGTTPGRCGSAGIRPTAAASATDGRPRNSHSPAGMARVRQSASGEPAVDWTKRPPRPGHDRADRDPGGQIPDVRPCGVSQFAVLTGGRPASGRRLNLVGMDALPGWVGISTSCGLARSSRRRRGCRSGCSCSPAPT